MDIELISYIIGGSFGLFLSIQHVVFYFIIANEEQAKNEKKDLLYIAAVGLSLILYAVFGALGFFWSANDTLFVLFYRLKLVAAISLLVNYVVLIRFIVVYIKDLGFVETDDYKDQTNRYKIVLYIVSVAMSVLTVFTNIVFDSRTKQYNILGLILLGYIFIISAIEFFSYLSIIRKEKGKITHLNLLRFNTIVFAAVITTLLGGFEIVYRMIAGVEAIRTTGSIFMYATALLCIALSLNLMFEYMEVLGRMTENHKKLTDLNRKIMDEVRTAQSLQISLLPIDKQREIQKLLDMEISYMPMQSVGGDYYDFYNLENNKILILIGDASGHGVYAAMIWAMLKVEVEELIEEKVFGDLAQAFTKLNSRITRILENTYSYATLFSCIIDLEAKIITYISAGHSDQIYFSARTNGTYKIRNKNPIIGTFKNAEYYAETISFQKGDCLLLFTDGVNEEVNPKNEQLGISKVEEFFNDANLNADKAVDILNNMLQEIEEFSEGTIQHDDRTVMVIKLD